MSGPSSRVALEAEVAALRRRVASLEERCAAQATWCDALERAAEVQDVEVWWLDHEQRVLGCNAVAARSLGRRAEELRGQRYPELMSTWDERGRLQLDVDEERRVDGTIRAWIEARGGQGERRFLRCRELRWINGDGADARVLVVVDITARRNVEEALVEHQSRLRLALASAAIGLWDWDIRGGVVSIDDNARRIFALESAAARQRYDGWVGAIHPEDRERVVAAVQRHTAAGDALYADEYRVVPRRGPARWVHVCGRVQERDRDGVARRMLGSIQDVTARKREAARLEESERRFRQLAENVPGVIYLCRNDERYSMLYINDAVETMTGYAAAEFLADRVSFVELYHPEDAPAITPAVERALAERRAFNLTYRLRHRSGEWSWVDEVGAGVYRSGELVRLEGFLSDVSARKRAEADRERLLLEFERKNGELERFAYTVSHDLKGPLLSIQGFAGLLEGDLEAGETARARDDLARIQRAAADMSELLSELLELSRVGRPLGARARCELRELCDEAIERLRGAMVGREIEWVIAPELPAVVGDRVRLLQLLQNLIANAIKYTRGQARARVEIGCARAGDERVVFVRDNGQGIEPRHAERVFDVFTQLDPSREGSGIGLAIARRIVALHGGRIWVESAGLGRGSTFYFTLDVADVTGVERDAGP